MTLDYTHKRFAGEQKDTEAFMKELKHIPRSLEASVGEIKDFEDSYSKAGDYAKEVAPVVDQLQEQYNRFAALVREHELSFCRKLAYNIKERSDFSRFGNEEYQIFVDRLPTYLA